MRFGKTLGQAPWQELRSCRNISRLSLVKVFARLLSFAFFAALIMATSLEVTASPLQCAELFQSSTQKVIHGLAKLRLKLDVAQAQEENSIMWTALRADYLKKEHDVVAHFENSKIMTRAQLVHEISQEISRIQNQEHESQKLIDQAAENESRKRKERQPRPVSEKVDGSVAIFYHIDAGKFRMGEPGKSVEIELTQSFDMMATHITQLFWAEVVLLGQSKLGINSLEKDPSEYKGLLNPVEEISYEKVKEWISVLNKLSEANEPALYDLIPDHKKGDVYRLPTDAEWEFVMRGRGIYNQTYFFGNDIGLLGNYAWYAGNSGDTTHPVAQKLPLEFEGKKFYDMLGNVSDLVDDLSGLLNGVVDPRRHRDTRFVSDSILHRGGNYQNRADTSDSAQTGFWFLNKGGDHIGFRLVRTVR